MAGMATISRGTSVAKIFYFATYNVDVVELCGDIDLIVGN